MTKLYIVEGADGTGKSTLCKELMEATKGHLLHGSWNKEWNIPSYHADMYNAALMLLEYQDVILDRWSVSEEVYANAFRGGSAYSADDWMQKIIGKKHMFDPKFTVFIYCENENVVENHQENVKIRKELFDDMSPVVRAYNEYLENTKINWIRYDFNKVDMHEFVKEITKDD